MKGETDMASEDKAEQSEEAGEKATPSTLKIIIVSVLLTVVIGGGLVAGTYYFVSNMNPPQAAAGTGGDETGDGEDGEELADSKPSAPPQYFSLDPKFVVSFRNQRNARFMQFSIEVMTRNKDVIANLEKHMPVIRSSLLMLFGNQEYEEMVTRQGKEKLLKDVVTEINTVLKKVTGDDDPESSVEAAYFTSFVIQ